MVDLILLSYDRVKHRFLCTVEAEDSENAYDKVIEEVNESIFHDTLIETNTGLLCRGKDIKYVLRAGCDNLEEVTYH